MLLTAIRLTRAPMAAFAAMGFVWGAFAAFLPEIKRGLEASDGAFGAALLFSAFGLATSMWLAPLAEAWLGRRAMPIASACLSLAFLLPAQAPTLPLFAAAMLVMGLTSGLTDVVMNSRVSEIEAWEGRSLMNVNHAAFSFAYAISAVATGVAREAGIGPEVWFAVITLAGLALTALMRASVASYAQVPELGRATFPSAFVFWGGAIVLVGFFAENATEAWSALHIERTLGGGAAEGSLGPAMLGLTMGIGRLSGQLVAERLPERVVLRWAALLAALGAVVAALAPTPLVAQGGFAIMGLGISVLAPMALALVGRGVPAALRTRAIARVALVGFTGFMLAPTIMGGLSELFGLRAAFVVVALLLLSVPALLVRLDRSAVPIAVPGRTGP